MAEFVLGKHRIWVDVERTRAWYSAYGEPAAGCTCGNCRNFLAAASILPKETEAFLTGLGLTLPKAAEVMEWRREADGRHWYTLQYHLVGEVLEQGDSPVEVAPEVTAAVTKDSGPFLKNFPNPCFQLFLDVRLPWVLEESEEEKESS